MSSAAAGSGAAGSAADFRPDVQGLRAVAVLLVVVYHLWPNRLTGGFVGVDVFFVISGYLITRHLAEDVERAGRVRLLRFWAKRARRLLPASLLVLGVSLVAVWVWLPQTVWENTARQVAASALYVQNWRLASDAVDYSALQEEATVAQHYWSLSVEEQFYLAWPLLIAFLLWIATRVDRELRPRVWIAVGLSCVGLASLWWSVRETAADQAVAYFVTPTRIWEFALGGLLGLVWRRGLVPTRAAAPLAWSGVAAVAWAGYTFDAETAFPGWVALVPVLGTALVLAAGDGSSRWGPRWLRWRPAVFVGTISYAVYLWHWPLIIVTPYALDRPMDTPLGLGILLASLGLAWATTRWVEDPLRSGRLLRPTGASLGFAAVTMAVVVAASAALTNAVPGAGPARAIPADTTSCIGPGALVPGNGCDSVIGDQEPRPGPAQVVKQNSEVAYPGCQASFEGVEPVSCDLGATPEEAERTVAIVGDSHATSWFPALDRLGTMHGWRVRTFTKTSCPPSLALRSIDGETNADWQSWCAAAIREVDELIRADDEIDAVFVASYSTAYSFSSPDDVTLDDPAIDGFATLWQRWLDAGIEVIAFPDVPRTQGGSVPTCLAKHDDPMRCAVPLRKALPDNRAITAAAEEMRAAGVVPIPLRDLFCDDRWCYPVVGSMIVYRDYSHLSAEYAEALVPFIDESLPADLVDDRHRVGSTGPRASK